MALRFTTLALGLAALAVVACKDDAGDKKDAGGKAASTPKAGGAPAAGGGAKYEAPKGTGVLKGVVKFKGTAPEQTKHKMDATPDCAAHGSAVVEKIQVNADGSLPHVFVYAVEGPSVGLSGYATADVEMDQVGCTYVPHVMGLVAGSKVNFKNGDKLSHNVHVKGKKNPDWNKSQSAGQVDAYTPVKEFGIKVICDVHSWMSSYIHVMDHPFFATSAAGNGAYEIKGLYPGKHKFKAWHENWAKDKQLEFEVEIKDGENPKDLEIEIK